MAKRSEDWSEGLAQQLRDTEVAREFMLAWIEEGETLREALARTVRAYGVTEFAKDAHLPVSNVSRALRSDYNPGHNLLSQMLAVLGLELSAQPRKVA